MSNDWYVEKMRETPRNLSLRFMQGRRSLHKGQDDLIQLSPKKKNKGKKSNMVFEGYKRFPSREEDSSSAGKSENREENPFHKIS